MIALHMPNGNRANNDKANMSVVITPCHQMFNNHSQSHLLH